MGTGLKSLARDWSGCKRCKLGEERPCTSIVFGAGQSKAKYLLLYDVPTGNDVGVAAPMSGVEGELLNDLLEEAKILVSDVYCTPLLGCRPLRYLPETADTPAMQIDREPEKDELAACGERVREIIYRLDPLVIFTLGDVAWKAMVTSKNRGKHTSLDKAIGHLFTTTIRGRWLEQVTYDVIALMSMKQIIQKPSYALHGPLYETARHLHKGRVYAEYLERTGKRDAQAAGYEPEQAGP